MDSISAFIASGWTPASYYPSNIEATKQDILDNPGVGFSIYWEKYETLNILDSL